MKKTKQNKGFFITFEGGEGAGKTTLIDAVYDFFKKNHMPLIKTREPGSTKLGEEVRDILLKKREEAVSPYAELCLYLAARAQHIKELILPSLNEGKIILCDRFNDSTIAYQGYARNLGIEKVESICNIICENLNPHLTIYLDIDPKIGLKRAQKDFSKFASSGGYDRIESESLSFHQKIRDGFYLLARKNSKRIIVIDAMKSKEEVIKTTLNAIIDHLNLRNIKINEL